jgi:hypothetical protein
MDTSNDKEEPKMQEDDARKKDVKEKETGTGNSSANGSNSGTRPD